MVCEESSRVHIHIHINSLPAASALVSARRDAAVIAVGFTLHVHRRLALQLDIACGATAGAHIESIR